MIVGYYYAYNVDDLYHTGPIDLPGMVKIVYIVCAHYLVATREMYVAIRFMKAWAADVAIKLLRCSKFQLV